MLAAGSLKERVQILQSYVSAGEYGEQDTQYRHVATVWANVLFKKGMLTITAAEAWNTQSITVTMRDNRLINENCKLIWRGKEYAIDSCNKSDGTATIVANYIRLTTDIK